MKKHSVKISKFSVHVLFFVIGLISCTQLSAKTIDTLAINNSGLHSTADTIINTATISVDTNATDTVNTHNSTGKTMVTGISAPFNGEFRAFKKLYQSVAANEIIGEIYNGGVWNMLLASAKGTISYILSDGQKAQKNRSVCTVDQQVLASK